MQHQRQQESAAQELLPPVQEDASTTEPKELSWDDVMPVDMIGLEVGYRLIPLVDRNQGGQADGADQRRAQKAFPGARLPGAGRAHPRQPGPGPERLSHHADGRAGGRGRGAPRSRTGHQSRPGVRHLARASPARTRPSAWRPCGSKARNASRRRPWATRWSMPAPWSPPICRNCCRTTPTNCSVTRRCSSCWTARQGRAEAGRGSGAQAAVAGRGAEGAAEPAGRTHSGSRHAHHRRNAGGARTTQSRPRRAHDAHARCIGSFNCSTHQRDGARIAGHHAGSGTGTDIAPVPAAR